MSTREALTALGLAVAVFTLALPGFAQMIYHDNRSFNWDQQGHRLVSTVLEPNLAVGGLCLNTSTQPCPKKCAQSTDCNTMGGEICCQGVCSTTCAKTCKRYSATP